MTKFSSKEKSFIEMANHATSKILGNNLDLDNDDDVFLLMRTFRGKGLITPRKGDGGKQFDLWHIVMRKVGHPAKTEGEVQKLHKAKEAEGLIKRTIEGHDLKIDELKKSLRIAEQEKLTATHAIEHSVQMEIDKIEKEKQEALERLETARSARERLEAARSYEQKKEEVKELQEEHILGGERKRKCWTCGEWFPIAGGSFTKHAKSCIEGKGEV